MKAKYKVLMVPRQSKHWYTCNGGKQVRSVTGILDIIGGDKAKSITRWSIQQVIQVIKDEIDQITEQTFLRAFREPKRKLDEAGDWGDKVHKQVNNYALGLPVVLDDESRIGFNNVIACIKKYNLKIIMADTPIFSVLHQFGGSFDLLLEEEDGSKTLADAKTCNGIRDSSALQLGGYWMAFFETFGVWLDKGAILWVSKTEVGVFKLRYVNLPNAFMSFKSALDLSRNFLPKLLWRK